MRRRTSALIVAITVLTSAAAFHGRCLGGTLVLDQDSCWRRYYRFATDHVSPAALKTEGAKVVPRQLLSRIQRDAQRSLNRSGRDGFAVFRPSAACLLEARKVGTSAALTARAPAGADWRDYVFVRMFYDPYTAPPLPDDWTSRDFDDSTWVLGRGTFQQDLATDVSPDRVKGNMRTVHVGVLQYIGTGLHSAFYRTRFIVTDRAKAKLSLALVYRGGVRVFVNGREVVRGHLPAGRIVPETPGNDYSLEAYRDATKRDRKLGPVKVPETFLVKGVNVLAVEVRASDLHPVVLGKVPSRSWNALHDREGLWRHGYLAKLALRGDDAGVKSATKRPPGTQLWVADIHRRVRSTDFRIPGEDVGTVRLVAAKNGTYSAQVVVGTADDLADLKVTPGALTCTGGNGVIPSSAFRVLYGVPIPEDELSDKLGDERGLGATFPTAKDLADFAAMRRPGPYVFDHLTPAAPGRVPADTARPVWLRLRVPPSAAPGKYTGTVTIAARGTTPVSVPVELEIIDYALPEPKDFETFVACEENPYGVAKYYGVKPWSDAHWRLLEASFRETGRIGNDWLTVPVLIGTEYGNRDDSPIRWARRRDGSLGFDFTVLDQYLDLAVKHWGKPRVVQFVVMHSHRLKTGGAAPTVNVFDARMGKVSPMPVGAPGVSGAQKKQIWETFGKAVFAHMKSKGLAKSMRWGHPHDQEADHEVVVILGKAFPQVKWVGGPHQIGNWGYPEPKYYDTFGTVRYFNNWPGFRMTMGWKAPQAHLAIPRIDSSVLSLCTASRPFAFRVLTSHALGLGRAGISRVGCDAWATAHYDGMRVPIWIVGMPVLFTLWPGPDGAETSARHEALLEGIQEGEARIAVERAIDSGRVGGAAARRLRAGLNAHFRETGFFQNKLCIFELEKYHHDWQQRSRRLYRLAAQAAKALQ